MQLCQTLSRGFDPAIPNECGGTSFSQTLQYLKAVQCLARIESNYRMSPVGKSDFNEQGSWKLSPMRISLLHVIYVYSEVTHFKSIEGCRVRMNLSSETRRELDKHVTSVLFWVRIGNWNDIFNGELCIYKSFIWLLIVFSYIYPPKLNFLKYFVE